MFVYCDPLNQEEKRSLIVIIVLENKKKVHELIYPRLEDHPECVKAEKDHRALIKGAATVRVAGMTIDATSEETRVERLPPGTPKKFGALMERTFWNFIRMETKNGCLAYFPENCKLPENYSAGLDLNAK